MSLLCSFSVYAKNSCPDLAGTYSCGKLESINIVQYEDDNHTMIYEMFNRVIITDRKTYVLDETPETKTELRAQCKNDKFNVEYINHYKLRGNSQHSYFELSRASERSILFDSTFVSKQNGLPGVIYKQSSVCTSD